MKFKKIISLILLLLLCFSIFVLPVHAEGPAKSKYFLTVSTNAEISNGIIYIDNSYTVSSGTGFSYVEIKTYVERRTLGLLWIKVDNGQPDKTWTATSTNRAYSNIYTLSLSQTGTYRVTAEYTFYGSNGSETITRQDTATY